MQLPEMDEFREQMKQTRKKRRKKRMLQAVFGAVLLLCAAGGVYGGLKAKKPQSQYDIDRNALAGFLPGKTEEEIQAELNRIIDKGRFNVSINPTPTLEHGEIDLLIENVPANHYLMQVEVLIPEKDLTVYQSGLIKPGYFIERAETDVKLASGDYNGLAVFHALHTDTQEEIGKTSVTMQIHVE